VVMQSKFSNRRRRLSSRGVELFFDTDYDKAKAKLLGLLAPSFSSKSGANKAMSPWQRAAAATAATAGKKLTWSQMARNMNRHGRVVTRSQQDAPNFWDAAVSEMPGSNLCVPKEVQPERASTPSGKVRQFVTSLSNSAPSRASDGPMGLAALAVSGASDKKAMRAAKKFRSKKWQDILLLPNPRPEPGTRAKPARIEIMDPENNVEYNNRALRVLMDGEVSKAQTVGNDIRRLTELMRHPEFRRAAERVGVDLSTVWPRDVTSFGNQRQSGVRIVSLEDQQSSEKWEAYLKWEVARLKRLALVMVEARTINRTNERLLRLAADRSRDRMNRDRVSEAGRGYGGSADGQRSAAQAITMAGITGVMAGASESKEPLNGYDGGDRDSSDPVSSHAIEERIKNNLIASPQFAPFSPTRIVDTLGTASHPRKASDPMGGVDALAMLSEDSKSAHGHEGESDDDTEHEGLHSGTGGARVPFGGRPKCPPHPPAAPPRQFATLTETTMRAETGQAASEHEIHGPADASDDSTLYPMAAASNRSSGLSTTRVAPRPPAKPQPPSQRPSGGSAPDTALLCRPEEPYRSPRVTETSEVQSGPPAPAPRPPRSPPIAPLRTPTLALPENFAKRFQPPSANKTPGADSSQAAVSSSSTVPAEPAHQAHLATTNKSPGRPAEIAKSPCSPTTTTTTTTTARSSFGQRNQGCDQSDTSSASSHSPPQSAAAVQPSPQSWAHGQVQPTSKPGLQLANSSSSPAHSRPQTRGSPAGDGLARLSGPATSRPSSRSTATRQKKPHSPEMPATRLEVLSSSKDSADASSSSGLRDAVQTRLLAMQYGARISSYTDRSEPSAAWPEQRAAQTSFATGRRQRASPPISRARAGRSGPGSSYRAAQPRPAGLRMAPGFGMAALHSQASPLRVISRHGQHPKRGGSAMSRAAYTPLRHAAQGAPTGAMSRL
jgi:hypothetical protein